MNLQAAESAGALNAAFAALADPTRRAILERLAQGETRVGDLVKPFAISGPAISRHLRVLEKARLIERKVDAQWRICRLNAPGLRAANDWLEQYRGFWEHSLDRLVEVLEQSHEQSADTTAPATTPAPAQRRPGSARGPRNSSQPRPNHPRRKP